MGDPRAGLDQAVELAIGQVDGVGEDGPRPEPAGAVVDIDVVERLGEQPRDLRDLAAVLGQVGLPPGAGRAGERRRLAQQLGRARDGEPRRDRVAEPAVVGAVPALDEVGPIRRRRPVEDRRRLDGRVVGDRDPSSPCPGSPGCRAPRPPGTRRPGWPRRPRRRPAPSSSRRPRTRAKPPARRRSAVGDVEAALEREDVALEPGQQVQPAHPSPAFGSCGRWACRSTMPGRTTHGRRSIAVASASAGALGAAPA